VSSSYEQYIQTEWAAFAADPSRASASREAVDGLEVARVLDVGCGAGQELYPFVSSAETLGVGVDVSSEAGRAGRELYAAHAPGAKVAFVRSAAEALPFRSGSFDVVVCRLALPYTDNRLTLAEIARVLQPGGVLLLKIHHARFYLDEMRRALAERCWLTAVHDARVLVAGAIYHVTRTQKRNRWLGGETFQTTWLLRRELARLGLLIRGHLPDTDPRTPSYVIVKAAPIVDRRLPIADRPTQAGLPIP
jgi:ubiquinone/menaquinone biosynthesis C-methylase UbiE